MNRAITGIRFTDLIDTKLFFFIAVDNELIRQKPGFK